MHLPRLEVLQADAPRRKVICPESYYRSLQVQPPGVYYDQARVTLKVTLL